MRKIYLVMISLSMIIGTFSFCISNVNAEELSLSYFDLDMYKANLAFKEGNNPINNGIPPYYEVVKTQHNMNHPSGILINGLNKDSSFLVKLKMFDLLTLDPSGLIEELSSESEYYTAILLAMLNISTTSDYRLEAMDSKWVESAKISGGWVLSYFKDEYNITVGLNSKIANIDNNKLKTAFQKLMKDKYNMVNGIDKGIELFDKYVTAMTTLEDIINHITTYINIYQLMDETFCVLDEMKNHTTNLNFKYALNKIVDCKDNTLSTISNCISDCKMDIFKTVYKTVVGKLWDDIALSSPFAPMYIAQKGGKALCDICFSTDQISEQYYKMEVLCSIENALNESVEILGNNYINNKNHNNALIYNHAVDLYYELYSISSDYAIEYADIIYKQSSAGIFLNKDNYNSFVKNVTSLKSIANQTKNSLKENYVYYLEEDYPELYREYIGSINDSKIVKVTGITIDADELEWGTDDMFNQIAYEIIPSNATNKKVTMTSSNENIVTITNNGSYIVKNPGEVTITFTTADGNFQDSVRIKAVKGHGKDGILIGDTISVETSGKCGEHVYYKLYDNGTLYIYGSGRMRNYISLYSICEKIKNVIIADGVTSIGNNIFDGCINLVNIVIPYSVTSIEYSAFFNCSSLTSITVPNSVTSIGSGAFSGCSGLTSITVPNSVTSLGSGAFSGCSGLTSITISDNVTSIGSEAFRGCSSLTSITIPNSVTSIGNGAFRYCSSLTSITIPNSVTSIGNGAFEGCSSLTNIIIPNSVTTIGDRAFANCSSLTNIIISNSVINIGDSIFANCSSLTNITVPDSVTSIERDAFYRCSSLTNIVIPNSVTSIGNGAFSGCSDLTSITIPNSVTSIESGAFSSCSSLISVIISDNITSIGHAVFWQCSSLRSITIPNSVTSIDWEAFYGCRSLRSIIIPDSVKWIDRGAFKRCNSLTAYIYADTYALQYVKDNGIPYKIIGTYIDQQTNIQIDSGTCNNIDETTELQVKYIKEGNEYNEVLKSLSDFNLYDISFYKDDEKVTIDGIATVKIPVGDKDPEKCKVYYYDNGKYVNMNAEYEEGYMVFQTEHFSHYILTEETALEENVLLGDVNEDGNIDFLDAIKVLRYDGELVDLNDNQLLVADVNKDNSVDFLDAIMILRYDAELIEGF